MFQADVIDALAATVALEVLEKIGPTLAAAQPTGWLNTCGAAAYLAVSPDALHRLTAARQIDFSQTVAGAPCYFRRADLDEYRLRHMQTANR